MKFKIAMLNFGLGWDARFFQQSDKAVDSIPIKCIIKYCRHNLEGFVEALEFLFILAVNAC
jgi:hypothetical protein